ncbi:MAG TPA: hypothetical protein VHR86_02630, partial [Armatimonadota bacterium]|nr:hypothetical protein [Armatimonadota bacterium]
MRTGKSNGRGQTRGERKLLHRLRRWLYTVETHRLTLALFTAAVITAISVLHLVPDKVSLQIGEVSPQEIRATRAARYIDTAATDRLRSQLLSTVTPEYEIDPYAVPSAEAAITQVFARLESAQEQMVGLAVSERARRLGDQIRGDLGLTLPQSSLGDGLPLMNDRLAGEYFGKHRLYQCLYALARLFRFFGAERAGRAYGKLGNGAHQGNLWRGHRQ